MKNLSSARWFVLSVLVAATGIPIPGAAQLISLKTVPVANGEQFRIFPSRNVGLGGASIALRDALLDPFVNPAKGARKLADKKRNTRLSSEQVQLLGKAMREAASDGENPTGLAVIRFILLSGFRRNEALAIERSWLLDAGGINFPDTKSGAQTRSLGRTAMDMLREQSECSDCKWFFPADRGDGHFVGVTKVLGRVCKRAELDGVTPHVLRHTFASTAGDLGYSELTIAGLLCARLSNSSGTPPLRHVPSSRRVTALCGSSSRSRWTSSQHAPNTTRRWRCSARFKSHGADEDG